VTDRFTLLYASLLVLALCILAGAGKVVVAFWFLLWIYLFVSARFTKESKALTGL